MIHDNVTANGKDAVNGEGVVNDSWKVHGIANGEGVVNDRRRVHDVANDRKED